MLKNGLVIIIFVFQIFSILWTAFDFTDMSYHSIIALVIAILFTMILIPAFGLITNSIMQESIEEQKLSYYKQEQFKKMFDSLQDGIIVFQGNNITFMNDLSNRITSEITGLKSFFLNKFYDGTYDIVSQLDKKIFYVFENSKNGKIKNKKKKKRATSSETGSKHTNSSDVSIMKTEYSLREIAALPTEFMNSKIFTFDKKLTSNDLTKMNEETKNLDAVIANLKCMRGIDEEYIPKFKFFTFKRSLIKDASGKKDQDQVMLCFSDISQKILYDTSKAEGELLSLINSTISHEMRNPLNSIINQCKIMMAMCL